MKAYLALLVGGEKHGEIFALQRPDPAFVLSRVPGWARLTNDPDAVAPPMIGAVEQIEYRQQSVSVLGFDIPVYVLKGLEDRARDTAVADLLLSDDAKRLIKEWSA